MPGVPIRDYLKQNVEKAHAGHRANKKEIIGRRPCAPCLGAAG